VPTIYSSPSRSAVSPHFSYAEDHQSMTSLKVKLASYIKFPVPTLSPPSYPRILQEIPMAKGVETSEGRIKAESEVKWSGPERRE
jgi:hypothetical protein